MKKNKNPLLLVSIISLIMAILLQGCGNTSINNENTAPDMAVKSEQAETKSEESVTELNTGTYSNGDNNIIIAKNDDGEYSYNLNVYDNTDDFRFLAGNIEKTGSTYIGTIDTDLSERYLKKKFSISPSDDSITISSDDDDLLFLCMKLKYTSEVDALEEDVSGLEESYISNFTDVEKGNADYKLTQGYYGFWNGETEYIFGASPDGSFAIDITEGLSSVLHAEGDITDNGDGTYNGTITSSDTDIMKNQGIIVSVLSEDTISIAGSFKMLDDIVHGTYQYAGFKAYDVDSLKTSDSGVNTNNNNIENIDTVQVPDTNYISSTRVPYVDWTMNVIGADWKQFKSDNDVIAHEGIYSNNTDYLLRYFGLSNEDKSIVWNGTNRQNELYAVRDGVIVAYADIYLMRDDVYIRDILPDVFYSVPPYFADSGSSRPWLTWKCNNAYVSLCPDGNWRNKDNISDMFMGVIVISEIDDNLFQIPSCGMYSDK